MSNIINKKVTINVNDVFTQEVMDNMHDAALFAMEYAKENGKDIEKVACDVIAYNIDKAIEDSLDKVLIKALPKSLDWKNKNLIDIFDEIKDILDLFDIVSLKKHKIKVKLNDEKTKDDIISWQALIKEDYPELKMNMIKLKEKDTYKIEISKIE